MYGIKYVSRLAVIKGFIDNDYYEKIIKLLDKFQLANKNLKFEKTKIINLMTQDKKVESGKINLLVPVGPAVVKLFDNIDLPSIEASLP